MVEGVVKAVAVAKRVDRRIELFMFCESESKKDWSMLAGQENRVEEQGEWRIGRGKDTYAGILGYIFYFMQPQMLSFFVFSLSRFCIDNHVTHSAPRRRS